MAAVRPYLLTDQNHLQADTSRNWEEFICKVSTKFLQWFRRRCDNGENQRWLPSAIFVDRPEPLSGLHNYTTRGTSRANFKKFRPVVSERCDNEKKFTNVWTDGRMDRRTYLPEVHYELQPTVFAVGCKFQPTTSCWEFLQCCVMGN